MIVTILVVPSTLLLLLTLELALTLELTLSLVLLLSSILILVPRILCLGRRARYQRDTTKQQQSQDCASKFFDAVHFHCLLTSAINVRNDHANRFNLDMVWNPHLSTPYRVGLDDMGSQPP